MTEETDLKGVKRNESFENAQNSVSNTYIGRLFGPEKGAKLLEKYFSGLLQHIDPLSRYLEDGNMLEIRKIAHKLKGSGKSYGFEYLSDAGIALSSYAKQEDFSRLKDLINDLERYIRKQKEFISKGSVSQ